MRPFPGVRISDIHHYFIPILNKNSDYIVLYVGTNDAVNTKASAIIPVEIICKEKLRNCKSALSRPTRRADNEIATVVDAQLIMQLKELQIDTIGNLDITRKDLGKKRYRPKPTCFENDCMFLSCHAHISD